MSLAGMVCPGVVHAISAWEVELPMPSVPDIDAGMLGL
jgi:hypothetical protein